jgi:hypothetical protein
MRFVVRCCAILLVFTLSFTTGSLVLGKLQPDPHLLRTLGFDSCDGKPCYMGIIPGETTWSAIEPLLQAHGAKYDIYNGTEQGRVQIYAGDEWVIQIFSEFQKSGIRVIQIATKRRLPYALFALMYGTPCHRGYGQVPNGNWQVSFRNINLEVSGAARTIKTASAQVHMAFMSRYLPAGCEAVP